MQYWECSMQEAGCMRSILDTAYYIRFMTKPRTSIHREIYGILGSHPQAAELRRAWERWFREKQIDATLERYPATVANLPERLSEMFHFDRRAYIIGPALQQAIIPLLDRLDDQAEEEGSIDTVMNEGGLMVGYWFGDEGRGLLPCLI
jgi:shikimate 5-dehydrogenase